MSMEESVPKCSGSSCCLSRLCQRALMPRSQESYIEDIFNHLLPYEQGLLPVSLQEKPMEATNECNIPIVFHCLPQISSTETSLYLCNIASWSQVGSLVKIMSADWCIAFGRAHSYLLTNENYNTFAWCIESCSPQAIYDLNKDRAQIWFCIPTKLSQYFDWLASKKLRLYVSSTMCKETMQELSSESTCHKTKILRMVLDNEDDASFLSHIDLVTEWTDELVAKYVEHVYGRENCTSPCSCGHKGDPTENSREDGILHERSGLLSSSCMAQDAEVVHEFDLKHIKRELKEENGEGEKDCGLDLEKLIQVPLQHNMFLRSEDSSLESVRSLISRYSAVAKRRGYHLVGSEPMLIVQCPGCCAEFRGLTNRMLRLVNHVTEQHQPSMHSRLISQIEKRYGALIEIIKTRLQKWIKRKNAVK